MWQVWGLLVLLEWCQHALIDASTDKRLRTRKLFLPPFCSMLKKPWMFPYRPEPFFVDWFASVLQSWRPLKRLPLTSQTDGSVCNGAGLRRCGRRNGIGSCSKMSHASFFSVTLIGYGCGVDLETDSSVERSPSNKMASWFYEQSRTIQIISLLYLGQYDGPMMRGWCTTANGTALPSRGTHCLLSTR